jgi:hypothetical protein
VLSVSLSVWLSVKDGTAAIVGSDDSLNAIVVALWVDVRSGPAAVA